MLNIIDLKYGRLVKQIIPQVIILEFYCCLNPRFIILQLQKDEFVIKDLLE